MDGGMPISSMESGTGGIIPLAVLSIGSFGMVTWSLTASASAFKGISIGSTTALTDCPPSGAIQESRPIWLYRRVRPRPT